MFSWSNTCAALDLSVDSISGEESFGVASGLHCIVEWGCNRPWESEGGCGLCAGLCASSLVQTEKFFSETGISMLNTAVTAADAVRNSARFDPWGAIDVEAGPVIADLKSCREKILSQRKAVRDTRDRWFSAETVASSAVGESAPRTTVRISDVVEVGDVQYVAEHEKLGLPCCSRPTFSPGKSKKRWAPVGPGVVKKQFSVSSPSASRPSFESALQKSLEKSGARRSGRDRRNAPVFQGG